MSKNLNSTVLESTKLDFDNNVSVNGIRDAVERANHCIENDAPNNKTIISTSDIDNDYNDDYNDDEPVKRRTTNSYANMDKRKRKKRKRDFIK